MSDFQVKDPKLGNFPRSTSGTLAAAATNRNLNSATILDEIRSQLSSRGARGIIGLSRKFKIMDDDNSGVLSVNELKKGRQELSIELSDEVCF